VKYKPLGIKSYGSIGLLPGSRQTPSDKHCHEGQNRIATLKPRDRHDEIIVQEKLDGSNVGVACLDGKILALTRAGYLASTSPFAQHWHFDSWVKTNESRFQYVLEEGERVCGEWLMQAHGTRYKLRHEPFVAFDLMKKHYRFPYDAFVARMKLGYFVTPQLLHRGLPITTNTALQYLGQYGRHGAQDEVEGVVYRIQRRGEVDFLAKYIKPDKVDGIYLPEQTGGEPRWNWYPNYDWVGWSDIRKDGVMDGNSRMR
jgi:hypothetical protein